MHYIHIQIPSAPKMNLGNIETYRNIIPRLVFKHVKTRRKNHGTPAIASNGRDVSPPPKASMAVLTSAAEIAGNGAGSTSWNFPWSWLEKNIRKP